jgi:hypothetical protein
MLLTLTIASLILPAVAFAAPPAPTQKPVQAPKAVQAPTQAPTQASKPTQAPTQAPTKTAQADTGYRTYSYQPGNYSSGYNYNNYGYGSNYRAPRMSSGFGNAGYKITDF